MKSHSSEKRLILPLDLKLTQILTKSQNRMATTDLYKEEVKKKRSKKLYEGK